MTGRVRVLPPDTPSLPPSVPFEPIYDDSTACMDVVWFVDEPEALASLNLRIDEGVYCTRPKGHPEEEIHVSHLRSESMTGEPLALVVWGGE